MFHIYTYKELIDLTIYEPIDGQFVWLSIFVHPKFRNGALSIELIKYLLYKLIGIHHIHPLKSAKTFAKAAKTLNWSKQPDSDFFEDCNAYIAKSIDLQLPITPLLDEVLIYRRTKKIQNLKSFASPKQLTLCLENIKLSFES